MGFMKRKRLRINDISVSYFTNSVPAPNITLVFIHGFPFNKNVWLPQFEEIPEGVKVVAMDVRGHGRTTSGHGFFNMDVFADDLIAFIEKMDLGKVVVCGCSMGGYIALRAYEKKPTLFSGLILSDTHSFADDNAIKTNRFDTIQAVLTHGKRVFSIGFVAKIFSEKTISEKPEVVELVKSTIRRNSERDICATLLALASRTDTGSSLKDIQVPVLIIRGEEDKLISFDKVNYMLEEIPDVRYIEIADCGHLPNLENSNRFNGEMKNFLISKVL
jgi:pimeloyl-ACP methyl ester carboxylesterase